MSDASHLIATKFLWTQEEVDIFQNGDEMNFRQRMRKRKVELEKKGFYTALVDGKVDAWLKRHPEEKLEDKDLELFK